ncbi:MAG: hypothetical protein GAK28_02435 [Luteibacter sp.]|nr:MAG: hypothetical protein GAK28_02435 [Luteibacter sp.]
MGVTQTTIQPPVKASISRASANKREPVQILHQFDFGSWPSIPSEQVFSDWLALRKKKRADVSETVIRAMGAELHRAAAKGYAVDEALATCVLRGWQGLEAKWLDPKTGGNHAADRNDHRESLAERAERLYAEGEAREAAIAAEQRELGHGW